MFEIFESEAKKVIKSHISNMVLMAKADGEFHLKEKRYIRKIGLKNGLNDDQITRVMFNHEPKKVFVPKSKKLRFFQLVDFVTLMLEDGYVSEQERNLFSALVHQLGFKKAYAGLISEKIERGFQDGQSKGKVFAQCINLLD